MRLYSSCNNLAPTDGLGRNSHFWNEQAQQARETKEKIVTMGIGSHQSTHMKSDEWLTPPEIIAKLGLFDLDPCSPVNRPWDTAEHHYTVMDDGLSMPWSGRIWLNPPYGLKARKWLKCLAEHGNGIALVFARTETQMFFKWVWPYCAGILFFKGRLSFYSVDGTKARCNGGGPSVLIAYGYSNAEILKNSGISGKYFPNQHILPPPTSGEIQQGLFKPQKI